MQFSDMYICRPMHMHLNKGDIFIIFAYLFTYIYWSLNKLVNINLPLFVVYKTFMLRYF